MTDVEARSIAASAAGVVARLVHPPPEPGAEWVSTMVELVAVLVFKGRDATAADVAANAIRARTGHDEATVRAMAAGWVDLVGRYLLANAAAVKAVAAAAGSVAHPTERVMRSAGIRHLRRSRFRDN